MQDSIWLYRIYEVAKEFDLEVVQAIMAEQKPISRMRLSRVRPKSIMIENPPITVELGTHAVQVAGETFRCVVLARIYDLGVVSLILQIMLPPDLKYDRLLSLAEYLYLTDELEEMFSRWRDSVTNLLKGVMEPLTRGVVEEDFTLFFFRHWPSEWDPVPILLSERVDFSAQVRQETMKNSFAYGKQDQTIITWDTALVYDHEGSTDIPDLIEFALTQLVELRYYDQLLSEEMRRMYVNIEQADRHKWYKRLSSYRAIMKQYMALSIDVNEVTEKIQNAIKVTEDIFYARAYGAATSILRTSVWMESIKHKLRVMEGNYSMLNDEVINHRAMLLELSIVLLIVFDILLSLGEKLF